MKLSCRADSFLKAVAATPTYDKLKCIGHKKEHDETSPSCELKLAVLFAAALWLIDVSAAVSLA